MFDVLLAGAALPTAAPLLGLIALGVKLTSPGSVIYRGKRIGRDGVPFYIRKFRTMREGADRTGPLVTAGGDPRVTRLGGWLRRTKLDELPSLWNILRGEMSWVGPRPENERSAALYTEAQRRVLAVAPGVTSPATIRYRNEEQLLAGAPDLEAAYRRILDDKLRLDLDYLDSRTFWKDLVILGRTVAVLFRW